jgi:hypothetical protein
MILKPYDWQSEYLTGLPRDVIMTCDTGTGKTLLAMTHAVADLPILVIAPPAKVNSKDWQEIGADMGREMAVVSFGKVAKTGAPTQPYILIVDEVHFAKSATTKRAKAVIKLATDPNCKQFIGLSATAIPNGYSDLQTYGIIFGWWKNKTEFMRRFVLQDRSRGWPRIIGYLQEEGLKAAWNSVAYPLDKSNLKIPELINITTTIKLTPKQRSGYNVLKNERVLADGTLLDTPSKLHATLRQYLSTTRVQALEAILDDTDEHILVFYSYNVSRDAILATAAKYGRKVYEQSGHASELPDGTPTEPSITLLQYQSGSAGLNLQYAPISVFYDPSYSYQDMYQATGRNHRGGQTKIVRHYYLKVEKSIDTAVYKALERKEDFNDGMLDTIDSV